MGEEEIIKDMRKDLLKQAQEDIKIWQDLYNQRKEELDEANNVIELMAEDLAPLKTDNERWSGMDFNWSKRTLFRES